MSGRWQRALWLAWLAVAVAVTAGLMRWHIEYFKSPGPIFYRLALACLPLMAAGVAAWIRVRRARLWRYEPAALCGVPAAVVLLVEPRAGVVALWMLAAAFASGRFALRRAGVETGSPVEHVALPAVAGFALLQLALFLTGVAGWWYAWVFAAVLAVPCILFFRDLAELPRLVRGILTEWAASSDLRDSLAGVLVPFAAMFTLTSLAVALAPTVAFDVIHMHLPMAQYDLQVHRLGPKPGLDYSYFPQGGESMLAVALALGGQPAAQLVPALFFGLTLMLLWRLARLCGSSATGALAGVTLALSLPFLHWTGSVPKNDLQLTAFLLASLACYLRWRETQHFGWIGLGVMLLASGFGVKTVAVLGALPLAPLFAAAAWRQPRRIRALALLTLIFGAFASVWHLYTYLLTGNPVYPLLAGGKSSLLPPLSVTAAALARRLLRLPWTMHFAGSALFESPTPAPVGIGLLVFWPVWLFGARPRGPECICAWFCLLAFLPMAAPYVVLRFAAAPLALVAALTGGRVAQFWRASGTGIRRTVAAAAVWALLPGLLAAMILEINYPQLRFLAGRLDRAGYLRAALVPYRSLEYLAAHTSPRDRILGLDNQADCYAPEFPRYRSMDRFRPWPEGLIEERLRTGSYTWLVVPVNSEVAAIAAAGRYRRIPIREYADETFVVFRLVQPQ